MDKSNQETEGKIPKTVNLSVNPQQKPLASSIPARVSVFLKWCGQESPPAGLPTEGRK